LEALPFSTKRRRGGNIAWKHWHLAQEGRRGGNVAWKHCHLEGRRGGNAAC
jgi:hypothetical protein